MCCTFAQYSVSQVQCCSRWATKQLYTIIKVTCGAHVMQMSKCISLWIMHNGKACWGHNIVMSKESCNYKLFSQIICLVMIICVKRNTSCCHFTGTLFLLSCWHFAGNLCCNWRKYTILWEKHLKPINYFKYYLFTKWQVKKKKETW